MRSIANKQEQTNIKANSFYQATIAKAQEVERKNAMKKEQAAKQQEEVKKENELKRKQTIEHARVQQKKKATAKKESAKKSKTETKSTSWSKLPKEVMKNFASEKREEGSDDPWAVSEEGDEVYYDQEH